ncbi:MAG: hypothetical protein GY729_06825, partial [Desulfobacteraceae bacterium]|nr:hypothetical protein [Desulfobacteraceae bacterium]
MPSPKIIFLCHYLSSDANRAQFNRVRFLCRTYPVAIVSSNTVSSEAAKGARAVIRFPFKQKLIQVLFPFWVLWTVFKLSLNHRSIEYIYSTYEPRILILGFVISKLFHLKWIADLWDDPQKIQLNTQIQQARFHGL